MPEWKEKITKSPANWLNELQKQYYVCSNSLRIISSHTNNGWFYVLVQVEGDRRAQPNAALYQTVGLETPVPVGVGVVE